MTAIQVWDGAWGCVMSVGRNPGMADVVIMVLTGMEIGHVPTYTVMELGLDVANCSDITPGCGILRFKGEPKAIRAASSS